LSQLISVCWKDGILEALVVVSMAVANPPPSRPQSATQIQGAGTAAAGGADSARMAGCCAWRSFSPFRFRVLFVNSTRSSLPPLVWGRRSASMASGMKALFLGPEGEITTWLSSPFASLERMARATRDTICGLFVV
jgi:hypothetical protein